MPLFAGGFCYIISFACSSVDALSNMHWLPPPRYRCEESHRV